MAKFKIGDYILTTSSTNITSNYRNRIAKIIRIENYKIVIKCDSIESEGHFQKKRQNITWIHLGKETKLIKLLVKHG